MLKPSLDDPNYKTEMKRFEREPEEWGAPGSRKIGVTHLTPEQAAAQRRGEAITRVLRALCARHGIDALRMGVNEKVAPIAEMLFDFAKGDESKIDYGAPAALAALKAAGFEVK